MCGEGDGDDGTQGRSRTFVLPVLLSTISQQSYPSGRRGIRDNDIDLTDGRWHALALCSKTARHSSDFRELMPHINVPAWQQLAEDFSLKLLKLNLLKCIWSQSLKQDHT